MTKIKHKIMDTETPTINEVLFEVNSNNGNGFTANENSIEFFIGDETIIKLCEQGQIFVKGKLIEQDKDLVDAMREFLKRQFDLF